MTPKVDTTSLHVRTMRPEERDAVRAFARNTWAWGDYLPEALDKWLSHTDGTARVAVTPQDEVIGFQYYRRLDEEHCWLSGLRVRPDYRRQGVANLMLEDALAMARDEGKKVVRYAAETGNDAIQKMSREHNLRPRGTWMNFVRTMDENACALQRTKNVRSEQTRPVPAESVGPVLSRLASEGHLFYVCDWTWRTLSKEAMRPLAEQDAVLESRSSLGGWSVGILGRLTEASVEMTLFGTDPACAHSVLAYVQQLACRSPHGVEIIAHVPKNEPAAGMVADLARRGYWKPVMEHSLRIWELRLNSGS